MTLGLAADVVAEGFTVAVVVLVVLAAAAEREVVGEYLMAVVAVRAPAWAAARAAGIRGVRHQCHDRVVAAIDPRFSPRVAGGNRLADFLRRALDHRHVPAVAKLQGLVVAAIDLAARFLVLAAGRSRDRAVGKLQGLVVERRGLAVTLLVVDVHRVEI